MASRSPKLESSKSWYMVCSWSVQYQHRGRSQQSRAWALSPGVSTLPERKLSVILWWYARWKRPGGLEEAQCRSVGKRGGEDWWVEIERMHRALSCIEIRGRILGVEYKFWVNGKGQCFILMAWHIAEFDVWYCKVRLQANAKSSSKTWWRSCESLFLFD